MSQLPVMALLAWATLVGLDLASVLQGLFNRPLVAGAVAGAIIGDPEAGLRIGAALELFALDVLPIGASRYPDYGAATVAASSFCNIATTSSTIWSKSRRLITPLCAWV